MLRRVDSGQQWFVFADSPSGGGESKACGEPQGEDWLLRIANDTEASEPTARVGGTAHLLEEAASPSNLARALLNVARNKGAAGVDGRSVEAVVGEARQLLPKLRRELLSGGYQPGAIRRVWIPKPGGGERGLGIPNVVDRWVQQAVFQVLEPVFEPTFHPSSHGFRPRRGASTAIAEAKEHFAAGYDWVVDVDLSKFFDRVHHQRLMSRLAEKVEDGRLLKLVHRMLKAKVVMPNGAVVSTDEGAPQGGPLSPLLSNVVLDELDQELARRGHRFVRYADDFQVFVRSERAGYRVFESIRRFIEVRLRLKVNEAKSQIRGPGRLDFLGFELRKQSTGHVEIHLSSRSEQRINTRVRELTPRTWGASLYVCMGRMNTYLRGWYGYFRLCTQEGADRFSRIDAHVRRRLRAIIIQHKGRRPRYLYRHLRARGVPVRTAASAAYRCCGPWKRSNLPGMTRAYRNAWFRQRVFTLADVWRAEHSPTRVFGRQLGLFD